MISPFSSSVRQPLAHEPVGVPMPGVPAILCASGWRTSLLSAPTAFVQIFSGFLFLLLKNIKVNYVLY